MYTKALGALVVTGALVLSPLTANATTPSPPSGAAGVETPAVDARKEAERATAVTAGHSNALSRMSTPSSSTTKASGS